MTIMIIVISHPEHVVEIEIFFLDLPYQTTRESIKCSYSVYFNDNNQPITSESISSTSNHITHHINYQSYRICFKMIVFELVLEL